MRFIGVYCTFIDSLRSSFSAIIKRFMTYTSFLKNGWLAKLHLAFLTLLIVVPMTVGAQGNPPPAPNNQPLVIKKANLPLIQPLDDRTRSLNTTNANDALEAFIKYFNIAWPWVLGCAAGIAVLQALVGGMQIMLSGSSNGSSAGKERIMWALAGLLLIGLSGLILEILNPTYYVQG